MPEPCESPLCLAHRHTQRSTCRAPAPHTGWTQSPTPTPSCSSSAARHMQTPHPHTPHSCTSSSKCPTLAPHPTPPSLPESCRLDEGSDLPWHSWACVPCPVDTPTYTSHMQTALLGLCRRELLAQPEMARAACCLTVCPSVCPLRKTQSYLHPLCVQVPSSSGLHKSWLLFLSLHLGTGTFRTAALARPPGSPPLGPSLPARPWPAAGASLMDQPP